MLFLARAAEAGYSGDRIADRVAASIAGQLRLVWNARGAAELERLSDAFTERDGLAAMAAAILSLDRPV